MKKILVSLLFFPVIFLFSCSDPENSIHAENNSINDDNYVDLPDPITESDISLEYVLSVRRSVRSYSKDPGELFQLSQVLWAAQGITDQRGFRTAPSAGALYPLEVIVCVNNISNLSPGIYRYDPGEHRITLLREGSFGEELADAALGQDFISDASFNIIITAVFSRITDRYSDRGINYAYIEAGHAGQNILLQAVALDMAAVPVGAFYDEDVSLLLGIDESETPIYIIPVGIP